MATQVAVADGSCLKCKLPGLDFSVYNESGPAPFYDQVIGRPDEFSRLFSRIGPDVLSSCQQSHQAASCGACGSTHIKCQYLLDGRLPGRNIQGKCNYCDDGAAAAATWKPDPPGIDGSSLHLMKTGCMPEDVEQIVGAGVKWRRVRWECSAKGALHMYCSYFFWIDGYLVHNAAAAALDAAAATTTSTTTTFFMMSPTTANPNLHHHHHHHQQQQQEQHGPHARAATAQPDTNAMAATTTDNMQRLRAAQVQDGARPSVVSSGGGGGAFNGPGRATTAATPAAATTYQAPGPPTADQQPPPPPPPPQPRRRYLGPPPRAATAWPTTGTGEGTAEQAPSRPVAAANSTTTPPPPRPNTTRSQPPAHVQRKKRGGPEFKDARENGVCDFHRKTKTKCECPKEKRVPAKMAAARLASKENKTGQEKSSS